MVIVLIGGGIEMTEENIIEFKCPHCGIIIEVKGCSTCVHNERNMNNYLEAKACWDCDMFHKNYKKKEMSNE